MIYSWYHIVLQAHAIKSMKKNTQWALWNWPILLHKYSMIMMGCNIENVWLETRIFCDTDTHLIIKRGMGGGISYAVTHCKMYTCMTIFEMNVNAWHMKMKITFMNS